MIKRINALPRGQQAALGVAIILILISVGLIVAA